MKEKIMNNFWLKVLAGMLAFSVWLIVNNVEDPVKPKVIQNVEVQLLNENAIEDKVFEVKSGGIINVTVNAKQSILKKITAADIVAVADLEQLSITNAVSIQLSCPKYEGVALSSDVDMMTITLEDEAEDSYKININYVGEIADGYAIGKCKVSPNIIKVSGAESQIANISEVCVDVDVSNATEGITGEYEPKAYDAKGKPIDSTNLTFSRKKVKVSVEVNETKTVPVTVKTTGKPVEGYHVLRVEYQPHEVVVTGAEDVLAACEGIEIPYDVTGATSDIEAEVVLSEYLPKGVSLVASEGTAQNIGVVIYVSEQELQKINLPLSRVEIRNVEDDLEASFAAAGGTIEVAAVWKQNNIDRAITSNDFKAYVDCEKLGVGIYALTVKYEDADEINIESELTVKVRIVSKASEEDKTTSTPKVTADAKENTSPEPEDEKADKEEEPADEE